MRAGEGAAAGATVLHLLNLTMCTKNGTMGAGMEKKIKARFFSNQQGREPVREWLKSLDKEIRSAIGGKICAVEKNWPNVSMPL